MEGWFQSTLNQVEVPLVARRTCQAQMRKRIKDNFKLEDSFVCAGGLKGNDTCQGDGGGPLLCPRKDASSEEEKFVQVIMGYINV